MNEKQCMVAFEALERRTRERRFGERRQARRPPVDLAAMLRNRVKAYTVLNGVTVSAAVVEEVV